jgi:hypothetical protein
VWQSTSTPLVAGGAGPLHWSLSVEKEKSCGFCGNLSQGPYIEGGDRLSSTPGSNNHSQTDFGNAVRWRFSARGAWTDELKIS